MARVFVARRSLRSVFACKLLALQFAARVKIFAEAARPRLRLLLGPGAPPPPRLVDDTSPRIIVNSEQKISTK